MSDAFEDQVAKVIGENMPGFLAMDDPWRQTDNGAVFDFSVADSSSVEAWRRMARAVISFVRSHGQSKEQSK